MTEIKSVSVDDLDAAQKALRKDGVVHVRGFFEPGYVEKVAAIIKEQHPEFADRALIEDFCDNGEKRFLAPVTASRALHDLGLFHHQRIESFFIDMLGEEYVVEAFRMMMAFTDCVDQHYHTDCNELFPELGLDSLLPPFSISFFFPLVSVGSDDGATQFELGTHLTGQVDNPVSCIIPRVDPGDAMIWDFRIMHRGLANRSKRDRPALHFNMVRPWWMDHVNYKRHNKKLVAEADLLEELGPRFVRAVTV